MGEDCGTGFPQQQFDLQSPNSNHPGTNLYPGQKNTGSSFMNPTAETVSLKNALPGRAFPALVPSRVSQVNEPCGWFYCLPRFRQAFAPASNSVLKARISTPPCDNFKGGIIPNGESGFAQKRFLVFDQSGDQTAMIFSSGTGNPVRCFTSWSPKPTGARDLNREDFGTNENINPRLGPNSNAEFAENNENDLRSETHEDTEELNALLYSDNDSDDREDDEVTSTGHSPSIMTAHDHQDWFDGSTEEVASSDGSTKKQKLIDGDYSYVPPLVSAPTSAKPIRGNHYGDDVESRCPSGAYSASDEMCHEYHIKRMRKERIRKTVGLLQDIIPSGKGKDAVVVLDEAIQYLKSLKHKAKALGLDAP